MAVSGNLIDVRKRVEALLTTFQSAILDLSVQREEEKESLSTQALEDTNYVIGMSVTNSHNLERILLLNDEELEKQLETFHGFLDGAENFANALVEQGVGFVVY